jgi:hypothetical protein
MLGFKTAFARAMADTPHVTASRPVPASALPAPPVASRHTSADPAYARLAVTAGRHSGAALDVTRPQIVIGSALTSNIVLTDPDVLPRHAEVTFVAIAASLAGNPSDRPIGTSRAAPAAARVRAVPITVAAIDGNVLVGIQMISAGQTVEVSLPCTLKFGACTVELGRPKPRRQPTASRLFGGRLHQRSWLLPTLALAGLTSGLGLVALAKSVGGTWTQSGTQSGAQSGTPVLTAQPWRSIAVSRPPAPAVQPLTKAEAATAGSIAGAGPAAAAMPAVPLRPSAAIATAPSAALAPEAGHVADLRQRLQIAGLDTALTVERRANLLVVDGIVGSVAYGRWREIKDALARTSKPGDPVITDLVKTTTAASLPTGSIASIVLGPAPYVLSTSGRRARVGEVLDDGWTVDQISAETVTLRRGQTVNRFNPADGFPK